MGFISKSIFEDILLFIVLENRFPDIEQLSGPQNEALFGILNRENVFAINHIPVLSISLPRIISKRVSLSKKCHCGSCCPFNSLVMSHNRELHTRGILKTAKCILNFFTSEDKTKPSTTEFPFFYYNG